MDRVVKGLAAASACIAGVAACASDGGKSAAAAPVLAASAGEGGAAPGTLPVSNLPPKSCGMVLWTLDERAPAPIFRFIADKSAEMVLNGAVVLLERISMEGDAAFSVFERQTFAAADGAYRVNVDVRFATGFDGGVYLERGVVAVETRDGWRTVSPAAGIAGCRR